MTNSEGRKDGWLLPSRAKRMECAQLAAAVAWHRAVECSSGTGGFKWSKAAASCAHSIRFATQLAEWETSGFGTPFVICHSTFVIRFCPQPHPVSAKSYPPTPDVPVRIWQILDEAAG